MVFLNPQQLELILDPKHSITIFQSDRARARMGELWKQCGAWLVRLNVLPPNHRWPLAKVSKNRRSKSNFVQCAATAFSKFSKIRLIAQDILARCHSARSSLRPERWRSPLPHASYHRPGNPGYETGLDLSINEDG